MQPADVITLYSQKNKSHYSPIQRNFFIAGARVVFLFVVLLAVFIYQASLGEFIYVDFFFPVLAFLSISFFFNALFLIFYEKTNSWTTAGLLALDALLISGMILNGRPFQGVFIFLYLANILGCGLIFNRKGAISLALWTSFLYSLTLIFQLDTGGQNSFLMLALNNVAFFAVAYLSGFLGEEIQLLGTQVKEKSRHVEALKDLNKIIVDNIGTGLLTIDAGGNITHSNRAALKILDTASLTGKSYQNVLPEGSIEFIASSLKESRSPQRLEIDFRDTRNEKRILEVLVSPIQPHLESSERAILLLQDLTEIKNLERQMQQKEKLAAVGQLAAGIAHEIRNPLASISGSVQMLQANLESENLEDARLTKIILKEIDRLNLLISEFLEFVRPEDRMEDPIDINSLLNEILDMCQYNDQLPREVEQKVELTATQIVNGNYDKLKQALLNIVINAYQAMTESRTKLLTVYSYDDEDRVILRIKDTGAGMSEDELRRIFEPFHTTKPKGTGLGLAVSHKILESHEATIDVDSKKGSGTVFTLTFKGSGDSHTNRMAAKKEA